MTSSDQPRARYVTVGRIDGPDVDPPWIFMPEAEPPSRVRATGDETTTVVVRADGSLDIERPDLVVIEEGS